MIQITKSQRADLIAIITESNVFTLNDREMLEGLMHRIVMEALKERPPFFMPKSYKAVEGYNFQSMNKEMVMIPHDNGPWMHRHDVEHAALLASGAVVVVK